MTQVRLDAISRTKEGLMAEMHPLVNQTLEAHTTNEAGLGNDDEEYGRGGYAVAIMMPDGEEYTVPAPKNGTCTNGFVQGCQGGCDGAKWYMGYDEGFAALAGVSLSDPPVCGFSGTLTVGHDGVKAAKCKDAIAKECAARCAQFLYATTVATKDRKDQPGYRTFCSLLSNWGAWISCSMYNALSDWAMHKGPAFTYANTLGTSKIHFVEVQLRHASRPHAQGLLKKGPGWDDTGSKAWFKTCEKYGLRGTYMRQNIGMYALMYEIGMYGRGSLAWSIMALDTKFFVDYNLASDNSPCGEWWKVVDQYTKDALGRRQDRTNLEKDYVGAYAAGCAFAYGAGQVKQRREQEAGRTVPVRRGGVVWEDKKLWTSFLNVDGGVVQLALMAGGCVDDLACCGLTRVINDVIDLGYDWGSGDVCNSILTLSEGKTGRDDLASAYTKVAAVLNRLSRMRRDSTASVGIVTTHAWQMCNSRHRVVACAMVSDEADLGPTTHSASWHEAIILGNLGSKVKHVMIEGVLEYEPGLTAAATLTDRSWAAVKQDESGRVAKLLFYGHQWLVDHRNAKTVASINEIQEIEDILRCTLVEIAMEMERASFIEALWCWTIENWCASDMMWHAMIGSTLVSSDRKVGSDRWDDLNSMPEWKEL